jgi:LytS/YehU family sensor histidine kinase
VNILLLLLWNSYKFIPRGNLEFPQEVIDQFGENSVWAFYVGGVFILLFMEIMVILLAVGIRSVMRSNDARMQLEEERRKSAEAELVWLKHQLNPHFLFNTLNNISSLTQIDPDKAQESIGQLSDLLRYALYDSEADKVPLASEMEFMSNYVDLMALRCNELTTVTKDFQVPQGSVEVAPLLFISLVENAFKHGVNARYPSFVSVGMSYADGVVTFRCANSLFEKQGNDHIGSGIGLENMKRRLELLYPGKYTYEQKTDGDTYTVMVTLTV